MKKTALILLAIISLCSFSQAQPDWQFIDCFDQFDPNLATGPFNLSNTDVYLDNNGQPWVLVSLNSSLEPNKLGRLVNGQWQYVNLPSSSSPFPIGASLGKMAFDDNNTPWVTDGLATTGFPSAESLHSFQNGTLTAVANTGGVVDVKKFENDPFLYLIWTNRVVKMDPVTPGVLIDVYEQPTSAAAISRVAKGLNGDVVVWAQGGNQADSLFVVDPLGGIAEYDLSTFLSPFSQTNITDMDIDGNGDVWIYTSTGLVHTLVHYNYSTAETFSLNTPAAVPDATCTNMVMDENDVIWLYYDGFVVQFSGGQFNIEQLNGAPGSSTFGYSNMHFRKDDQDNIWYIGILPPDGRYGLVVANTEGLKTLSGNTFIDWNQNQLFDAGDAPAPISVQAGTGYVMTLPNGGYHVYTSNVNTPMTVAASPQTNYAFTTPSSYTITPSVGPTADLNFGIYPSQSIQDLSVSATSGACRPGFVLNQWITYENNGTTISDADITFNIDPELTYITADPAPSTVNGNQLVWNATAMQPFATSTIHIQMQVDATAMLGDTMYNSVTVDPINTDATPLDNVLNTDLPVTGSFDPNDKTATPADIIGADEWIDYRIRFQNTGTDTAFNVYLKDEIDFNLNQSTLEIVGNSHPMRYGLADDLLEFWFDDILLPDSNTNEALSHGFVMYRIKTKADLQPGDEVSNTAYIYFDFNFPIITNTTVNAVPFPDAIDEHAQANLFEAYPNPNQGNFVLKMAETMQETIDLTCHNTMGQLVFSSTYNTKGSESIVVETELPSGIYFISVSSGKLQRSMKMVVE